VPDAWETNADEKTTKIRYYVPRDAVFTIATARGKEEPGLALRRGEMGASPV
jgi:hypothetical protein